MRNILLFALVGLTFVAPVWAQVCVPPPSGIVAWWPAEGNVNDIIGSNNGTLEAGVTFAPGEVGQAFRFNGLDGGGGVNLGNVPAFDFTPSSSFTIEAWINSFGSTHGQFIVILNYNCSNTVQTLAVQAGTNLVHFQVRDANGVTAGPLFAPTALPSNSWHHVSKLQKIR